MKLNKKICIGAGLVSLDILMRGYEETVSYKVGGTCGNVMMILAYLGWESYPVARLNGSDQSKMMLDDMHSHGVHTDFVSRLDDGVTPIIIQHNIIDKDGNPTHKFTFQGNRGSLHLDYKPVMKKTAMAVLEKLQFEPSLFFFDRVSAATLAMSSYFKNKNTLVFFEPSAKASKSDFDKAIASSDIIKFADQRLSDVSFTDAYQDKLFIQTLGSKGLKFNLFGKGWISLPPVLNNSIVDTSGAGDWTTATLLNEMANEGIATLKELNVDTLKRLLIKAQENGSKSCSYEGARGMMQL